jgi:hypothetical protein
MGDNVTIVGGKDYVQHESGVMMPGPKQLSDEWDRLHEAEKKAGKHLHFTFDCEGCLYELEETELVINLRKEIQDKTKEIKRLDEKINLLKQEVFYLKTRKK